MNVVELIHDTIHGLGLVIAAILFRARNTKAPLFYLIINTIDMKAYLAKNYKHIFLSAAGLIAIAYNVYQTKTFTNTEMAAAAGLLGLSLTTNSGTTTPPAAN
jgi:hypothetical protein